MKHSVHSFAQATLTPARIQQLVTSQKGLRWSFAGQWKKRTLITRTKSGSNKTPAPFSFHLNSPFYIKNRVKAPKKKKKHSGAVREYRRDQRQNKRRWALQHGRTERTDGTHAWNAAVLQFSAPFRLSCTPLCPPASLSRPSSVQLSSCLPRGLPTVPPGLQTILPRSSRSAGRPR